MPRHRARHARPSLRRRITERSVLPLAVAALLGGGTGLAAWVDRDVPAAVADSPAGTATGARTADTADRMTDARATRPNRDAARTPLASPSASSTTGSSSARSEATREPTSTSTPTSESKAKSKAKAKAKPAVLGAKVDTVVGRRYLRTDVTLRVGPGRSYAASTGLKTGSAVAITDRTVSGWTQLSVSGRPRWVPSSTLTSTKPSPRVETSSACPGGNAVESGLTPDAVRVHRAICAAFPQVRSYGGVRADALPEHPSGRALDAMISDSTVGWRIAGWVRAHARELGVSQVIYSQKIWTVQRSSEGWRSMSDRGSATANHYDHVHVTVYGNAATG